jgi:hypothetical protein
LAASEAQIEEVRALHKDGKSRRFIVGRTGLGERTVRTIIEKKQGKDRTSRKRAFERKLFKDKLRAAAYRRSSSPTTTCPSASTCTRRPPTSLSRPPRV